MGIESIDGLVRYYNYGKFTVPSISINNLVLVKVSVVERR